MSFVFVVALFAASLLEKTALHFNATKMALPPKNVAMSRGVRWREKTERGGAIFSVCFFRGTERTPISKEMSLELRCGIVEPRQCIQVAK
ncbi:hypothetical protein DL95DRAFT_383514 [Leptodontidium sp. 2 PMI_412]|nr:hypothetical protein DL95DRAFT_383514 [Leptodontidium sp. 2 PMI_412]